MSELDDRFDEIFPRGRRFFTLSDYEKMAEKTDLEYVGMDEFGSDRRAPISVKDKCWWKCKECGFVSQKTYRAVRKAHNQGTKSCYCQNYAYSKEAYEFAGNVLGFTLVGQRPRNNKIPTQWLDFYGSPIEASFVEVTNNPKGLPRRKFFGRTKPECWVNGVPHGPSEWKERYGVDLLPERNNFVK